MYISLRTIALDDIRRFLQCRRDSLWIPFSTLQTRHPFLEQQSVQTLALWVELLTAGTSTDGQGGIGVC
jgi:hypothetical protein